MKQTTKLIVNLDALHQNINSILEYKSGMFLFVLKSNAYGHGYLHILQELEIYDSIHFIGVATPDEALYLSSFTKKKIVVLGFTPDEQLPIVIARDIIPSIFSLHQASLIKQHAEVFVNVDTGFHRLGGDIGHSFLNEIKQIQSLEFVNILGIFTHLSLRNDDIDQVRIMKFNELVSSLDIPYISISDSIAFTRFQTTENLYRIGASMYGITSVKETGKISLIPTTSLISYVTRIQKITNDTEVFYRSHVSAGKTIATIQIGYGDGLFRSMSEESYVLVNQARCPYIEVGMDQSLIDITGVSVMVGDSVIIFDETQIPLEIMASWCNTNKNNILVNISNRVRREYWKQGKVINTIGLGGTMHE